MASAYVSPGVYIREDDKSLFVSNLADTPLGVVGLATWGPVNEATLVTSNSNLFKTFGDFTGASNYNEAVANYPDKPMLYAADRYLRRGRRLLVVRVGDTDSGNTNALAKATGYLSAQSDSRRSPSANTTVPFVANPTTPLTAAAVIGGGTMSDGEHFVIHTWLTANGETLASPAQAVKITLSQGDSLQSITVTGPIDPSDANVTGFNLYLASAAALGTPDVSTAVFHSTHTTADYGAMLTSVITTIPVNSAASQLVKVTALYNGTLGNRLRLHVARGSNWIQTNPTFKITVFLQSPISTTRETQQEVYDAVVMNPSDTTNDILARINAGTSKSSLISVGFIEPPATDTVVQPTTAPASLAYTNTTTGRLAVGTYKVAYTFQYATESIATPTADAVVAGSNNGFTFEAEDPSGPNPDSIHVYISEVGGAATDIFRVVTVDKPSGGWIASVITISVENTARTHYLALSTTSTTRVSMSGGANGEHATGDSIADQESVYVGTPESLVSDPTGLQIFRNAEANRIALLAVPGVTLSGVVNEIIDVCKVSRGDCLGIIDPPANLKPQEVVKWHNGQLGGSGDPAITLNSSYAALYWPWLQVLDSLNEQDLWLPPSGFAAETMAFNDFQNDPWFAPAGLTRGKITGIKKAQYQPNQGDRDVLYSSGNAVNPITTFAANGVVIWGQRTLQREPTALDRVNVRRLLIQLRLVVDAASRQLVFQPNDNTLWRRFVNLINPVLEGVKQRRGLVDFKVVMDSTTNTPDVIEQNQAVGNIFLKPTKAAEIIVLNFIVTTQASTFDETVTTGTQ
jgi:phage tail sheath protein FI